jgi:hypothetical protein
MWLIATILQNMDVYCDMVGLNYLSALSCSKVKKRSYGVFTSEYE